MLELQNANKKCKQRLIITHSAQMLARNELAMDCSPSLGGINIYWTHLLTVSPRPQLANAVRAWSAMRYFGAEGGKLVDPPHSLTARRASDYS